MFPPGYTVRTDGGPVVVQGASPWAGKLSVRILVGDQWRSRHITPHALHRMKRVGDVEDRRATRLERLARRIGWSPERLVAMAQNLGLTPEEVVEELGNARHQRS